MAAEAARTAAGTTGELPHPETTSATEVCEDDLELEAAALRQRMSRMQRLAFIDRMGKRAVILERLPADARARQTKRMDPQDRIQYLAYFRLRRIAQNSRIDKGEGGLPEAAN